MDNTPHESSNTSPGGHFEMLPARSPAMRTLAAQLEDYSVESISPEAFAFVRARRCAPLCLRRFVYVLEPRRLRFQSGPLWRRRGRLVPCAAVERVALARRRGYWSKRWGLELRLKDGEIVDLAPRAAGCLAEGEWYWLGTKLSRWSGAALETEGGEVVFDPVRAAAADSVRLAAAETIDMPPVAWRPGSKAFGPPFGEAPERFHVLPPESRELRNLSTVFRDLNTARLLPSAFGIAFAPAPPPRPPRLWLVFEPTRLQIRRRRWFGGGKRLIEREAVRAIRHKRTGARGGKGGENRWRLSLELESGAKLALLEDEIDQSAGRWLGAVLADWSGVELAES